MDVGCRRGGPVSARTREVYDRLMGRYDSLSDATLSPTATAERVTTFLRAVYGWMAVGLAITALVAAYVAGTDWATTIATNRWLLFALLIAQLGVVITLSAGASRLAP